MDIILFILKQNTTYLTSFFSHWGYLISTLVSTTQMLAPNLTTWQKDFGFIAIKQKGMESTSLYSWCLRWTPSQHPPLYTADGWGEPHHSCIVFQLLQDIDLKSFRNRVLDLWNDALVQPLINNKLKHTLLNYTHPSSQHTHTQTHTEWVTKGEGCVCVCVRLKTYWNTQRATCFYTLWPWDSHKACCSLLRRKMHSGGTEMSCPPIEIHTHTKT